MENSTPMAMTVGGCIGVLIWMLAPQFIGHVEPWSAGTYYALALLGSGVVAGAFVPGQVMVLYVSAVAGQAAYAALNNYNGIYDAWQFATLLVYTLIFMGGAIFGARLQRIF
jgi:hypothetical protein